MSVYACSDLHGNYNLWNQIKNYLHLEDTLYFLGDAADRGADGWKIIKELVDDERVIYLCGNHEQMLLDSYKPKGNKLNYNVVNLLEYNGGKKTFSDASNDPQRKEYFKELRNKIIYHTTYINSQGKEIFMSHSGAINTNNEYDLIWDRTHFYSQFSEDFIVVHGHTPISYMIEMFKKANRYLNYDPLEVKDWKVGTAYSYCNDMKWNIDTCTVETHTAVLLNLDTFEQICFSEEN